MKLRRHIVMVIVLLPTRWRSRYTSHLPLNNTALYAYRKLYAHAAKKCYAGKRNRNHDLAFLLQQLLQLQCRVSPRCRRLIPILDARRCDDVSSLYKTMAEA